MPLLNLMRQMLIFMWCWIPLDVLSCVNRIEWLINNVQVPVVSQCRLYYGIACGYYLCQ